MTAPDGDVVPSEVDFFSEAAGGIFGKAAEAAILAHTGDPFFAAAAGGGVDNTTKRLVVGVYRVWNRRRRNLGLAAEAAYDEAAQQTLAGLTSMSQLLDVALDQDDERRLDLLLNAFRAAAQASDEQRVRFYGRIAVRGVLAHDDAQVDEKARVFSTIATLDAADLKVLLHMAAEPDQAWSMVSLPADYLNLSERLPELGALMDPIVSRLVGLGLLVDRLGDTSYSDAYVLSPFARLCVRELLKGDGAGR